MTSPGLPGFIDQLRFKKHAPSDTKRESISAAPKAEKPQNSAAGKPEFAFTKELEYNSTYGQERRRRSLPPADQSGGERGFITNDTPKERRLTRAYKDSSQLPEADRLELVRLLMNDLKANKAAGLQLLVAEFALQANAEPALKSATGPLREDPKFIQFVKDNLWETRRERGIPWRKDVFEFITETYGPNAKTGTDWIGRCGMAQADLVGADDGLYGALRHRVSTKGAPSGFHFPSRSEASLSALTDPSERAYRTIKRGIDRKHAAAYRSRRSVDN